MNPKAALLDILPRRAQVVQVLELVLTEVPVVNLVMLLVSYVPCPDHVSQCKHCPRELALSATSVRISLVKETEAAKQNAVCSSKHVAKALPVMSVTLHNWAGHRAAATVLSTVSCPLSLRRTAFQLVAIARHWAF